MPSFTRTRKNFGQTLANFLSLYTNLPGIATGIAGMGEDISNFGWDSFFPSFASNFLGADMSGFETDQLLDYLSETIDPNSDAGKFWNSQTASQKRALVDEYYNSNNALENWGGFLGDREDFDLEGFLQDLNDTSAVPNRPDRDTFWNDAQAAIDAENAEILGRYDAQEARLDRLLAEANKNYASDMNDIRSEYSNARTGLMSSQYQQNAQLMDTMQSQMSKQSRNALEAGASAGLRIAGNINTMLSVQNKQSQQSLETSNQLAQMLLNQKAAERGIRNDYNQYMQQDAANRASIDNNRNDVSVSAYDRTYDRFNKEHNRADSAYNEDIIERQKNADTQLKKNYLTWKQDGG